MRRFIDFTKTSFIKSAPTEVALPHDSQIEIAFAGRSNVGKSSVLNLLSQQKNLARISKTPGRTQAINFFEVLKPFYLVDLPGYGYAKVSHEAQAQWEHFLMNYILKRNSLIGIILIMDARQPFTGLDEAFIALCQQSSRPCHILLNKMDKLTKNERNITWQNVQNKLMIANSNFTMQFFSVRENFGLVELKDILTTWVHHKKNL
jgi:GTP-binding protein